jgi:FkbM family methyltransferase
MKIVDKLEDTLNGGYGGLYGEVVTCDSYRLRGLDFVPDVVFDIGANIGVFTRYARSLFPDAFIMAVEPDEENIIHFKKFTQDPKIVLLEVAMGNGVAYRYEGGNGSQHCFLSSSVGYPSCGLEKDPRCKLTSVYTKSLAEIVLPFWIRNEKTLMKIDCEGAENSIWLDPESMEVLKQMDYFIIELHYFAIDGVLHPEMVSVTNAALASFEATHICHTDRVYFYARKKS